MQVGDLVILNPNSGVIMDMFEDDPDEYEQELKWIGVITQMETDYQDHTEIAMVHWSHKTHSCPEYVDYLLVVEQPDKKCP